MEVEPETVDAATNVTTHLKAYSYTGWWPDADNVGQGIGCVYYDSIKNITQYQGEWGKITDFPNNGTDLTYPPAQEYNLVSLMYRQRDALFGY